MNKILAVLAIMLAAAVLLLSAALLYSNRTLCNTRPLPQIQPGNTLNQRLPFQENQNRPGQGNPLPPFNAGGQPGFMGGNRQGPAPQNMPNMDGGMQGFNHQSGQTPEPTPNTSAALREQVSRLMQESVREAQDYFRDQNHRPESQEMQTKIKELMTQKMIAQGIAPEVQRQILERMDRAGTPQQQKQNSKAR